MQYLSLERSQISQNSDFADLRVSEHRFLSRNTLYRHVSHISHLTSPAMADPYPNESANTIYTHLRSLSNTFSDLGDTITSLHLSSILSSPLDPTMPSFSHSGSIRRRFLRLISFGRYSSGSTDDLEPLTKSFDGGRRHSAPADLEEQSSRPTYTAHQSPHSSDTAQTTIVHGVPAGKAPFSISGLRDKYRGRVISDAEFDTPPSLEAAQDTIRPAGPKRVMAPRHGFPLPTPARYLTEAMPPAGATAWPTIRDPIRLRRDKSYLQCNVCSRALEYNQIHCPSCAARTLHHVPIAKENSDSDGRDNIAGPKTLQPKKQRQREQHDVVTEESSWNTQGIEAGTVEESWTTTTNDAVDTTVLSPKHTQESTSQSIETQEPHSRCCCCCCCRCDTGIITTHHGCYNASSTRCCTLGAQPITATVIFLGPVSDKYARKCRKQGLPNRLVCYLTGDEHIHIVGGEAADRVCKCGGGEGERKVLKGKTGWWKRRWSRWFCCC